MCLRRNQRITFNARRPTAVHSGADSMGTLGVRWHVPLPFTNGWARGGAVSRRTANKKLTKLYTDYRKSARRYE